MNNLFFSLLHLLGLLLESGDVKVSDSNITKIGDILETTTITRYIYIENLDSPVKIFRETAV